MKKSQDKPADAAGLRRRAEERLQRQSPAGGAQRTEVEAARLVHELEVHQIELEMQNEELQQAHARVEALVIQYTDLYDFAPTGYFSLDRQGTIRQVNLNGARLLGVERSRLVNRRFGTFVAAGDRPAFSTFLQKAFANLGKECCEVALPNEGQRPLNVRIEGVVSEDGQECRAMVLDLTERRQAEEQALAAAAETSRLLELSEHSRRALLSAAEDQRAVVEALRASEAQMQCVLGSTADGILAVDHDGKVILTNQRFAELWRVPQPLMDSKDDQTLLNFVLGQLNDSEAFLKKVRELYKSDAEDLDMLTFKDGRVFERYSSPLRLHGAVTGRVWSFRDITEREQAEHSLRAAEEQFRGLVEQSIAGIYIIQNGKFAYVNPRFAEIRGYASADELIGRDPTPLVAEKDRGTVAENHRRLLSGEVHRISYSFTALRKDGSAAEVGVSCTCATYRGRPAVIGLMQDISEKKRAEEQIQRYVTQLETAFMSTVAVATTLSEMRDPYTAGHERRVAEIAVAIGGDLGLDKLRLEGLRVAGYLHDIGKITIPSEILSKPGKLSTIEFALIQGHAQASYDVLKDVEFPWPVAQIALQHHERIDGSGYPQGLKGEAILLEARIMAVADVIEAMSSHRPYRPGLGLDEALAEIERGRGTLYDANVADACMKLFREKGYAIPV